MVIDNVKLAIGVLCNSEEERNTNRALRPEETTRTGSGDTNKILIDADGLDYDVYEYTP